MLFRVNWAIESSLCQLLQVAKNCSLCHWLNLRLIYTRFRPRIQLCYTKANNFLLSIRRSISSYLFLVPFLVSISIATTILTRELEVPGHTYLKQYNFYCPEFFSLRYDFWVATTSKEHRQKKRVTVPFSSQRKQQQQKNHFGFKWSYSSKRLGRVSR